MNTIEIFEKPVEKRSLKPRKNAVDDAKRKRRSNMSQIRRANDALGKLDLRAMPRQHLGAARELRQLAERLDQELAAYEKTR